MAKVTFFGKFRAWWDDTKAWAVKLIIGVPVTISLEDEMWAEIRKWYSVTLEHPYPKHKIGNDIATQMVKEVCKVARKRGAK